MLYRNVCQHNPLIMVVFMAGSIRNHLLSSLSGTVILRTGMLILVMVLFGCQTAPQKDTGSGTSMQDSTPESGQTGQDDEGNAGDAGQKAEPRIVRIEPVRPKIELTGDLLYKLLIAEVAVQRGHLDLSVENYIELARQTRDPKVVERATRIAVYARETEAATEAAELWAELDPRNPDPHQILAVMSLRQGNVEVTMDHLQQILKYTAGDFRQKLWLVVAMLSRERNKDLVMDVMERLLAEHSDEADAVFAFADIAARMGDLDRSLELLTRAIEMAPENDNVALSYVNILQRMDRRNDAIEWLEDVLEQRDSDDFNLRLAYARLLFNAQRLDDARRQFEILAVSAPNNPDVLNALGYLYYLANRLDEAEMYFKRLSEQDGRFDNAKYYLGLIAEERRNFDEASVWYQSVQNGEYYFDAQLRYGLLLSKQKSMDDALAHLKSIQAKGIRQETLLVEAIAGVYVDKERYADAMAIYDKALVNKYNADLLYSRAMLAEKMDMIDLLEEDLRQILSREPNHAHALNALGYTLADRTDRYQEAYDLINKALALEPEDMAILDSMGWVLYRLGRHEEAIDYLRRAMAIRQDPEIAAHLGEVLWVAGDKKGAKKVWETALQITPEDSKLIDVINRFTPAGSFP